MAGRGPVLTSRQTSGTACAPGLVRTGVDETTGEALTASALVERVGWCTELAAQMTGALLAAHFNTTDVDTLAAWPADPGKRTEAEWDAVRAAIPGGEHLPSSVIRSRTRQITSYLCKHDRLPADVFELEPSPAVARMLVLAACDAQQATIERHESDPTRALLRLHAKADQYTRLADPALDDEQAVLAEEIQQVCERRSNLNDALARSTARWTVDQAVAAAATVVYLEGLRSMEAGGMGRTHNTRLSQTVRGQLADRMRHLAAEVGIAVVTVPAKNTSKYCPHCLYSAAAPQSPRPARHTGLEVGPVPQPRMRPAGRSRPRGLATYRRTRPDPPGQDRRGQDQRHHGDPQGRGQDGSQGRRHSHSESQPERPVQDRTHPAPKQPPRAQATRDSLPCRAAEPGRKASGGTRTTGSEVAAPRSPPAPGRGHTRGNDQHTHHQPTPATRSSAGCGIPSPRSRCPAQVGRTRARPYGSRGFA